jgi:hypothetical protein
MPENKTVQERLSYLSWSKMNLWEKDPNLFYQVYVEGIDMFRTKQLELGKKMATALENGSDPDHDPLMEMMLIFMPDYPLKEFDIKAVFEEIPIVGKLDGFNEATLTVGEYKSGKNWTQAMVDQHGQLTFYALLVWLKYKKLPKDIFLHWAKTQEDEKGLLTLTGDIRTFKTNRTMKDIILFSKRIKSAWEGICELGKFTKNGCA